MLLFRAGLVALILIHSMFVRADDPQATAGSSDNDVAEQSAANAEMRAALEVARSGEKDLMVIFGANWCDRCVLLDRYMTDDPLQSRIDSQFVVMRVDVGFWDANRRYESQMGHPTREGLPAVIIVDASQDIARIMDANDHITFLPDRDQPIFEWMENILQYAEQMLVVR